MAPCSRRRLVAPVAVELAPIEAAGVLYAWPGARSRVEMEHGRIVDRQFSAVL